MKKLLITVLSVLILGLSTVSVYASGTQSGVYFLPTWQDYGIVTSHSQNTIKQIPGLTTDASGNLYIPLTPTGSGMAATKGYVDTLFIGLDWQASVLNFWDASPNLPVTPTLGDRYISSSTANGWVINHIYQCLTAGTWAGASDASPNKGFACNVEDENVIYTFNGTAWVLLGTTFAHNDTIGKQGGTVTPAEYFHLTSLQSAGMLGLAEGRIPKAGAAGVLGDSVIRQDASGNIGINKAPTSWTSNSLLDISGNLIISSLTASMPVETDVSKNLVSGTKTGTGSIYVMQQSPSIVDASLNTATFNNLTALLPVMTDVSKNLVTNAMTGTGSIVFSASPSVTDPSMNTATLNALTASMPVETDVSKNLVSGTKTGTGSVYVMDASPTIQNPVITGGTINGTTLSTVTPVQLGLTPTPGAHSTGKFYWDTTWKTGALQLEGDSILQMGQETMAYVYALENLVEGDVAYIYGASDNIAAVYKGNATQDVSSNVLGIVTMPSIAAGSYGYVTIHGYVNDIDTTGALANPAETWAANDLLYLSPGTSGKLTNVQPIGGLYDVKVARVIKKDAVNGNIYVNIRSAYKLGDLSNVTSVVPVSGQILKYNGTEWTPADSEGTASAGGTDFYLNNVTVDIEGMTNAVATEVTWTGHGLTGVGNKVKFSGITQANWTVLNSPTTVPVWYNATVTGLNTFTIPVNSTAFGAYNAGIDPGKVTKGLLPQTPDTTIATVIEQADSSNNVEVLIDSYSTLAPLGRTSIEGGEWVFKTWCYASSNTDINIVVIRVYNRTAGGVETQLFTVATGDLGTVNTLSQISTVQPAFPIALTDYLVIRYYAKSDRSGNVRTLYLTHNGTTVYSFVKSPLSVSHNQLGALNTGAYRHNPAAVADNDFVVGQASDGNWLKKTLAESRTILGLDGATTTIAVGGGAGVTPTWTTATGTGAPVRASSPSISDASMNTATLNNLTASMPVETTSGKVLTSGTKTGTGSVYVMKQSPEILDASMNTATFGSLTASLPVFTNSSKTLASNTITGTGKVVMDSSPTITTPTFISPVLGTPASGVATNLTGTATALNIGGNAATVTTNANLTGMVTSVGNAATVVTNANLTGDVTSVGNATTVKSSVNLTGAPTTTTATDNSANTSIATTAYAKSQDAVLARSPNQGVAMTAAASGSSGISVADNDNIDFGTGNFTLVWKGSLPNWTSGLNTIIAKYAHPPNYYGYDLSIRSTGLFKLWLYRNDGGTAYDSTATLASVGVVNGSNIDLVVVVTRETDTVNGSVVYYVNGVQLGASVPITAVNPPVTIDNTGIFYLDGDATSRVASTVHHAYTFNRALSVAEVLDLYRNGVAEADKWGSQTNLETNGSVWTGASGTTPPTGWHSNWATTGTYEIADSGGGAPFDIALKMTTAPAGNLDIQQYYTTIVGKKYRLIFWYKKGNTTGDTIARVGTALAAYEYFPETPMSSTSWTKYIVEFVALTTSTCFCIRNINVGGDTKYDWLDEVAFYEIGATLALEPEGINASSQWQDATTNKLHALLPVTGASITRPNKTFEIRGVNTWAGTHEPQSINSATDDSRAILPANCYITDIIGVITGGTIEDIIIGDGSDTDRWVTITTGLATGTVAFTVANRISDGTNYEIVIDPDANFTGSIAFTIKGIIL